MLLYLYIRVSIREGVACGAGGLVVTPTLQKWLILIKTETLETRLKSFVAEIETVITMAHWSGTDVTAIKPSHWS